MKKIRLIFFAIISIFICLFCGCNNSKQLNERMVIQGMGVDYENDQYVVTVMYMNTDESQQESANKIAQGKGKTVTDAVTSIVDKNGLEPLYSHNSFILFGEKICKKGLKEPLEFFAGYYQCRPSVNLLVADRQAYKIIQLPELTVDVLDSIAESPATTGRTSTTPMYMFMAEVIDKTTSATTSLLTVKDDAPEVAGVAVFQGDKLRHILSTSQAMGMLLLRGETDISAEVIPFENGNKSFALSQESSSCDISVTGGILHCNVKIKGEAKVYEYTKTDEKMEEIIEKRVIQLAQSALTECKKYGSDIFYFGKMLRQQDYDKYNNIADWNSFIKNAEYTVNSDIKLK